MQESSISFSEVQSLYELCTFSTDLKKFCRDLGVNYDKYVKWRQRFRIDETTGRTIEVAPPGSDVMSEVTITGIPVDECNDPDELRDADGQEADPHSEPETETDIPETVEEHSGKNRDGIPIVKGFNLKATTLADVICAGKGLDMELDSFKIHMHDGLNIRHTHIPLRQAIIILHQLNIMYSC